MPDAQHSALIGTDLHEDKRIKQPVRAASTANVTLTAPGTTIDGVTLANGDRILLKDQSTASQNGLYVWSGASSTLVRTTDAAAAADFGYGFLVFVREGTANGATLWQFTQSAAVTVGTTALTFGKVVTGSALADPTTTRGDLIARGASAIGRLAVGAAGTFLGSNGTDPAWGNSAQKFTATGDTGATAASAYIGATASGAPASGTHALGDFVIDQTGKLWICTTAGTPGTWTQVAGSGGGGGGVGLGSAIVNQLAADVSMTVANTFYDGPAVTLGPGTWQLIGHVTIVDNSGLSDCTAKLWDGTTVTDSGQQSAPAGYAMDIPVTGVVSPTTSTTYKISVASSRTTGKIKAATPQNASGNTASTLVAIPVPPVSQPYVNIQDQKTSGTNGGTFTSGADRTRDLNTEVEDTHALASVAANQITLAAGTWRYRVVAPAHAVNSHQAILYNVTDTVEIKRGMSVYASSGGPGSSVSEISGRFTITATKVLEVRHRCQTTGTTNGFGVASGFGTETYTIVELFKEG